MWVENKPGAVNTEFLALVIFAENQLFLPLCSVTFLYCMKNHLWVCSSLPNLSSQKSGTIFYIHSYISFLLKKDYLFHFPILESHIFLKKECPIQRKLHCNNRGLYCSQALRIKNKSITRLHRKLLKKTVSSSKRNFRTYLTELLWEEKNLIAINKLIKHIAFRLCKNLEHYFPLFLQENTGLIKVVSLCKTK